MAKITDFVKLTEFLKPDHLKNEQTAEITGEAEEVENKFGKGTLQVPVKLDGNEYTFSAGKLNAKAISDVLGDETKEWIGKAITFEIYSRLDQGTNTTVPAIKVKAVHS